MEYLSYKYEIMFKACNKHYGVVCPQNGIYTATKSY